MELIDVQIALGIMFAVIAVSVVWIGYVLAKVIDLHDSERDLW